MLSPLWSWWRIRHGPLYSPTLFKRFYLRLRGIILGPTGRRMNGYERVGRMVAGIGLVVFWFFVLLFCVCLCLGLLIGGWNIWYTSPASPWIRILAGALSICFGLWIPFGLRPLLRDLVALLPNPNIEEARSRRLSSNLDHEPSR
jgi:hypothetical protein